MKIQVKRIRRATYLAFAIISLGGIAVPLLLWGSGNCSHTRSGSRSISSFCVRCTPMGPMPINNGLDCSYYLSSENVFCEDCAPCYDCFIAGPVVRAWILLRTGGVCFNGGCLGATNNSSWYQDLPIRADAPCVGEDPYAPCRALTSGR